MLADIVGRQKDRQPTSAESMAWRDTRPFGHHNIHKRTREMTHLYLAVMVESLATLGYVVYMNGFPTNTLPLLSTFALVLTTSFVSSL